MINKIITDMYKNKKTGIIISAFSILLIFILLNLGTIFGIAGKLLYAIRYLFYGIIIAYILNQPMMLIENFLKKHFTQNSFLYKKKPWLIYCNYGYFCSDSIYCISQSHHP